MIDDTDIVLPGSRLAHCNHFIAGKGTHIYRNWIYASILGEKKEILLDNKLTNLNKSNVLNSPDRVICVLNVLDTKEPVNLSNVFKNKSEYVAQTNDFVIGKVIRVSSRKLYVQVLLIDVTNEPTLLKNPYRAEIKINRITHDIENKLCSNFYNVGDYIRAIVIFPGSNKSLASLSTIPPECGVIFATSRYGGDLEAISNSIMKCKKSSYLEERKVAKGDFDIMNILPYKNYN